MTTFGVLQLLLYLVVLIALVKPLGWYMARVYQGQPCGLDRALGWLEHGLYRLAGTKADAEMTWQQYAIAMLLFNMIGLVFVYGLQRTQHLWPLQSQLNPAGLGAVTPDSSFNTAVSFATNTNWQGYGGETTMSYLTQMLGLTVQNFVSAATGMACLVALIRGFTRKRDEDHRQLLGRSDAQHALYPAAAVARAGDRPGLQGVVQTFSAYAKVTVLQPTTFDEPAPTARASPSSTTRASRRQKNRH